MFDLRLANWYYSKITRCSRKITSLRVLVAPDKTGAFFLISSASNSRRYLRWLVFSFLNVPVAYAFVAEILAALISSLI